jgi:peptidyl-prolyl cis-trans isomerase A (cyclophilin A)
MGQSGSAPDSGHVAAGRRFVRVPLALLAVASVVLVGSCVDEAPPPSPGSTVPPPSASPTPAPDSFRVKFETSRGDFVVAVTRAWSPTGADRFYELVRKDYFNDVRFFRVLPGFVAQFGMHGNPEVNAAWSDATIADEPLRQGNVRGTVVYATSGPNTRSNQLFINLADNERLDGMGFSPFGRVVEGMDVVQSINSEYGEAPDQAQIGAEGNAYLQRQFPRLDYIRTVTVVAPDPANR